MNLLPRVQNSLSYYPIYNYNSVSVRAGVRPTRQFRVLMDRRKWPGRSDSENRIRPGQSDSENGSRDSEKRAARQGRAGQGAGQGPSVRLSCRAWGRAVREGQGPNKD